MMEVEHGSVAVLCVGGSARLLVFGWCGGKDGAVGFEMVSAAMSWVGDGATRPREFGACAGRRKKEGRVMIFGFGLDRIS